MYKKLNNNKGFTLIELLVVIAIIGILAGILFITINPTAQVENASDSKVKSQILAIQTYASTVYFGSGSTVLNLISDLKNASVKSNQSNWAAKAQLENGNYYCRDSTGKISELPTQDITDYLCD